MELNCHEKMHFLCVMFSAIFRGFDGAERDLIFYIMRLFQYIKFFLLYNGFTFFSICEFLTHFKSNTHY